MSIEQEPNFPNVTEQYNKGIVDEHWFYYRMNQDTSFMKGFREKSYSKQSWYYNAKKGDIIAVGLVDMVFEYEWSGLYPDISNEEKYYTSTETVIIKNPKNNIFKHKKAYILAPQDGYKQFECQCRSDNATYEDITINYVRELKLSKLLDD